MLWAYVALHLANHAAGLVSLEAAEALRRTLHGGWATWPGTLLLYGAFAVHLAMACAAVWQRRSLRMPAIEAVRLALGLALPLLLAAHAVGTRWTDDWLGVEPGYARIVRAIWTPEGLSLQWLLLAASWAHGCLGLHLALRSRAGWRRWQPLLLAGAVLLPVLAALGVVAMARELQWRALPPAPVPTEAGAAAAHRLAEGLRIGWLLALAALLALRWGRGAAKRRRGSGSGSGAITCAIRTVRSRCRAASACWRPAACTASPTCRAAAGGRAAPPAGCACRPRRTPCPRRAATSARRSRVCRPRPTCGWPASCARRAMRP